MAENKVIQTSLNVPTYMANGSEGGYIGLVTFLRIDNFNSSPPAVEGTGTGFFIKSDLVATNSHVINGAKNITVTFRDQKVHATVLSEDTQNDVAILKVCGLE